MKFKCVECGKNEVDEDEGGDEYVAPSGETISKYKDGPYWYVTCDNEDENRWTKMYRNEDDANIEFERWRK